MSAEAGGGRAIPEGVHQLIEQQRAQLMRASTVLTCLWITSLYQKWHDVEIDADDVALLVRKIVDDAVKALDIVLLEQAAKQSDNVGAPDVSVSDDLKPPDQGDDLAPDGQDDDLKPDVQDDDLVPDDEDDA